MPQTNKFSELTEEIEISSQCNVFYYRSGKTELIKENRKITTFQVRQKRLNGDISEIPAIVVYILFKKMIAFRYFVVGST